MHQPIGKVEDGDGDWKQKTSSFTLMIWNKGGAACATKELSLDLVFLYSISDNQLSAEIWFKLNQAYGL